MTNFSAILIVLGMSTYNKTSTQAILYPYLVLAQCFALFPVTGIRGNDFRTIRFYWRSKRMVYSLLYLTFNSINLCLYFIKQVNGVEFLPTFSKNETWKCDIFLFHAFLVGLVYFTATLFSEIFFINLAKNWPRLMRTWTDVDLSMASYSHSHILSNKLKVTSIFFVLAAFGEFFFLQK